VDDGAVPDLVVDRLVDLEAALDALTAHDGRP
jgi:hypothetical protein